MRIAKRAFPLALLAAALAAPSCATLGKQVVSAPKVRVVDARLSSNPLADRQRPVALTLTLAVENPNPFAVRVATVAYAATVADRRVAEGARDQEVEIAASGTTRVDVPLEVEPDALVGALRQVLATGSLRYAFSGSVGIRAPVAGLIRVPFAKSGTVDPADLLRRKGFVID